ncbi:MAG: transcriptional repressor [Myxococcales bacterium]|nr:transcriptional repressor [Myxococcales bacterium]
MTFDPVADWPAWRDRVVDRLQRDHQRATPQRMRIVETLWHHGHLNVDELHREVRKADASVGYATVYRTLKLLERCGLVNCSNFGDGTARYEVHSGAAEHHDHMICTDCGTIVEFENDAIELLQEEVARSHGYVLKSHRMDLFGICPACQALAPR